MFKKPTRFVPSTVQDESVPLDGVPSTGVVSVGEVKVLLVRVSVVARPTNVSVLVGSVNVPVLLMLEIIGAVSVLFVSVSVLVAVTMLLGVIIPDRVVMFYSGCVGQTTVFGNPACAGTSRSAWRYGTYLSLMAWGVSAPCVQSVLASLALRSALTPAALRVSAPAAHAVCFVSYSACSAFVKGTCVTWPVVTFTVVCIILTLHIHYVDFASIKCAAAACYPDLCKNRR